MDDTPFPLDHFFFCFLPAAAAAGAYLKTGQISGSHSEDGSHRQKAVRHTMIADFQMGE